ncbi:MAG: hypothetical protein ACO2ZE_10635 [Pseudohongiellaceae bacterium]
MTLKQLQNRRHKALQEWLAADNDSDRAHAKIMQNAYQERINLYLAEREAKTKRILRELGIEYQAA